MEIIIKRAYFYFWIPVVLTFGNLSSFAQEAVELRPSMQAVNITSFCGYFRTSEENMPVDKAASMTYTTLNRKAFLPGFSKDVHWLKVIVFAQESFTCFFEWQNPLPEYLDFYIEEREGTFTRLRGGSFIPLNERSYKTSLPSFELHLEASVPRTFYIRIQSQRGFYATLAASGEDGFAQRLRSEDRFEWLFNGMLFFKVLFVTILALFVVRQRAFRLFTFHTFLVSATVWGFSELFGDLFTTDPKNAVIINALPYHLLPMSYVLVTFAVIPVKKAFPSWVTWVMGLIIAVTLFLCGALVADYRAIWLEAIVWDLLVSEMFCMGIFIYALIRKIPFNLHYTAPFFLSFTGYIFLQLRLLEILDWPWINEFSLICVFLELFVFIFFIGQVISTFEKEKARAAQLLLAEQLQAQKLKELDTLKSRFFTNISHEFRTPLTLLLSPIDTLQIKYPGEKVLEVMKRNVGRLRTLINQLLDISKLEAGELKPEIHRLNLRDFILLHGGVFSSLAESKGIAYTIRVPEQGHFGYFDPEKLLTIVSNLLSNAFKFTDQGQSVTLSLEISSSGKEAVIRVEDSGIGISEAHLDKIFDRFYQADSSMARTYEGSGIGLALARELASLMKGSLRVKSKENEGTCFTLSFPVDRETWRREADHEENQAVMPPSPIPKNPADPIPFPDSEGPLLLVIDDNPDIRAYLHAVLREEYQVLEAANGQDGLRKAIAHLPDLVICDLMMPGLDGFSFCKMLKSNPATDHIPVIMLTALASQESKIEGLDLGADDYLTKPFHVQEIRSRINNLIKQREALRAKFEMKVVDLKPTELKVKHGDEVFVDKIKTIVEEYHTESRFDLEEFSSAMNMTQDQLRRKLKAVTGLTPIEFIRKYRLQKAAQMIRKKSGTVSEIAFRVGFESPSYFTRVFQEEFGVKPSEFYQSAGEE